MVALAAAIVLALHGFGVLDNTGDVNWLVLGAALWALHFAVDYPLRRG